MEEEEREMKSIEVDRRTFLKYSAAVGAAAAVSGINFETATAIDT
jgi:Ni,Fe-hydrogenase I small subunit